MSPLINLLVAAALPLGGGGDAQLAFTIKDARITESSGLAASLEHPGIVYTHNDSGASAQIFALDGRGRTKAVFTLAGANARDWEAMAIGKDAQGRSALFIADIGDNQRTWPYVTVYRVREPSKIKNATLQVTAFRFTYADGPRDAESLLIDPRDNRLYVSSKALGGSKLYQAPKRLSTSKKNVLRPIASSHSFATDGAFAPDGSSFVVRGYFSASLYSAPGKLITTMSLPSQEQGESVTYTPDGRTLLISSEQGDRKVWRVPLPAKAVPATAPPKTKDNEKEDPGTKNGLGLFLLGGAVVAAVALGRRRK